MNNEESISSLSERVISELEFCLNRAPGSLKGSDEFGKDIVLDSLDDHEVLLALETALNVTLEPAVWNGVSTVSELVFAIEKVTSARGS